VVFFGGFGGLGFFLVVDWVISSLYRRSAFEIGALVPKVGGKEQVNRKI